MWSVYGGMAGNLGTFLSSTSGLLGRLGGNLHFIHGLAQAEGLKAENDNLNKSNNGKNASQFNQPPIGFRFVLALLLCCDGFLFLVKGWEYFDNKRHLLGSSLIGLGVLLCMIGMGNGCRGDCAETFHASTNESNVNRMDLIVSMP